MMHADIKKLAEACNHPWTYLEPDGRVRYDPKHHDKLIEITSMKHPDTKHWQIIWGPPECVGLNFISKGRVVYTGDEFALSFGGGWMPLLPLNTVPPHPKESDATA